MLTSFFVSFAGDLTQSYLLRERFIIQDTEKQLVNQIKHIIIFKWFYNRLLYCKFFWGFIIFSGGEFFGAIHSTILIYNIILIIIFLSFFSVNSIF
jgi:hypothetical protein